MQFESVAGSLIDSEARAVVKEKPEACIDLG